VKEKYELYVDDDNILHILEQTNPTEQISQMAEEVKKLKVSSECEFICVDLTGVNIPPSKARKKLVEMISNLASKKFAVFGTSVSIRALTKFIISVAGIKKFPATFLKLWLLQTNCNRSF